jgi:DNA-binding CsgD family transcriptional regulator
VPELPAPLRLAPALPFVGRSVELSALRAALPRDPREGRRIALIGGEAGSGKTRLVREFAHETAAQDVRVLLGTCDAIVPAPYRPFVEALHPLLHDVGLRAELGVAAGELGRLAPELWLGADAVARPLDADPDTARLRLHTAVGELLTAAGRRESLLLILEDVHWADVSTLLLIRQLARSLGEARVLLLATFRDLEADVPAELAEMIADLRRIEGVLRLPLAGLTTHEIADFVRLAGGEDEIHAGPELLEALRDLTRGNAFLLGELWRGLRETGAVAVTDGHLELSRPLTQIATPESVREVTAQRVTRLEPITRDLLELAAVTGREFDLALLRRAASGELPRLDVLEPAVASGMIEELPGPAFSYRFTHELVRRALYDRLGTLRRAELHLQVGEALERTGGASPDELHHHFAQAAALGTGPRAVRYGLEAARAASAGLAYDEASTLLRSAVVIGIEDLRSRAETQLELGTTLFRAGRTVESLATFRDAAVIARELADGELLARAAIGFETTCWRPGIDDAGARSLLEEASAALPPEDSRLRVELLAGVARALEVAGETTSGELVRDEAIAMARRIDDRHGLAQALVGSYWARGKLSFERILPRLHEARAIAEELGDVELQAEAILWTVAGEMALGEVAPAERELDLAVELAHRTRQPFVLHAAEQFNSSFALLEGRLADAEAAAERSREWGLLLKGRDASATYGVQMFAIRREQGRLSELAPVVRVLVSGPRGDAAWAPGLGVLLCEMGLHDEARRILAEVRARGLGELRRGLWLASLTYLTDAASALADAELAALLLPALEPHAGAIITIGHGVGCYGAADRYLGMLAALLGDGDRARSHFAVAMAINERMGAHTWLSHTGYEYGRLLLAAGETERARSLLDGALAEAERVGQPALAARIRALTEAASVPATSLPDGLSARELDVLRLVAQGRSNRQIGTTLFISEHTAANHVRSILRKTASANRAEATAYAYRTGLAGSVP